MAREKPWGGRFRQATDPTVERFSASIHFDRALARYDIRGSIAHARMLGHVGLLSAGDAEALVGGLVRIAQEIEAGQFPFDGTRTAFRPDPQWSVPAGMPAGWDRERGR